MLKPPNGREQNNTTCPLRKEFKLCSISTFSSTYLKQNNRQCFFSRKMMRFNLNVNAR